MAKGVAELTPLLTSCPPELVRKLVPGSAAVVAGDRAAGDREVVVGSQDGLTVQLAMQDLAKDCAECSAAFDALQRVRIRAASAEQRLEVVQQLTRRLEKRRTRREAELMHERIRSAFARLALARQAAQREVIQRALAEEERQKANQEVALKQLRAALTRLKSQRKLATVAVEHVQEQLRRCEAEAQQLASTERSCGEKLHVAARERDAAVSGLSEMQARLDETQRERRRVLDSLEATRKELLLVEGELQEAKKAREEAEAATARDRESAAVEEAGLAQVRQRRRAVAEQLRCASEERVRLQGEVDELQSGLTEAQREWAGLSNRATGLRAKRQQLAVDAAQLAANTDQLASVVGEEEVRLRPLALSVADVDVDAAAEVPFDWLASAARALREHLGRSEAGASALVLSLAAHRTRLATVLDSIRAADGSAPDTVAAAPRPDGGTPSTGATGRAPREATGRGSPPRADTDRIELVMGVTWPEAGKGGGRALIRARAVLPWAAVIALVRGLWPSTADRRLAPDGATRARRPFPQLAARLLAEAATRRHLLLRSAFSSWRHVLAMARLRVALRERRATVPPRPPPPPTAVPVPAPARAPSANQPPPPSDPLPPVAQWSSAAASAAPECAKHGKQQAGPARPSSPDEPCDSEPRKRRRVFSNREARPLAEVGRATAPVGKATAGGLGQSARGRSPTLARPRSRAQGGSPARGAAIGKAPGSWDADLDMLLLSQADVGAEARHTGVSRGGQRRARWGPRRAPPAQAARAGGAARRNGSRGGRREAHVAAAEAPEAGLFEEDGFAW